MAENTEKCSVLGCIHHETSTVGSGKPTKVMYPFTVHFRKLDEVYKHAMIDMGRDVALLARSGNPIPVREDGSPVDIYADCSFTKTLEDELADIAKMSQEEKEAYEADLNRRVAAWQKAQSIAASEESTIPPPQKKK
jgi:hypothetical protein